MTDPLRLPTINFDGKCGKKLYRSHQWNCNQTRKHTFSILFFLRIRAISTHLAALKFSRLLHLFELFIFYLSCSRLSFLYRFFLSLPLFFCLSLSTWLYCPFLSLSNWRDSQVTTQGDIGRCFRNQPNRNA